VGERYHWVYLLFKSITFDVVTGACTLVQVFSCESFLSLTLLLSRWGVVLPALAHQCADVDFLVRLFVLFNIDIKV
jgi:hypothetical protein